MKRLAPGERIVVPVVYHVVYGSDTPGPHEPLDDLDHAPPLALVHRQTRALNRAFRGTGISFFTEEAQLRSFDPWRPAAGDAGDEDRAAMVRELMADRRTSLHVFLLRAVENRAASPQTRTMFDEERDTDAVMMDWDYLPYVEALRPIADRVLRRFYAEGDTLVHLVGHYFGLLHTFEPWLPEIIDENDPPDPCRVECSQTTDYVHDTPAHRSVSGNAGRCIPRDSCKDAPGMDPITNYMNLEPDLCASELTPGQVARVERMVRTFRCHLIQPRPAECR